MLKNVPGHEMHVHFCDMHKIGDKTTTIPPRNIGRDHGVQVEIHDVHPRLFVESTNKSIPISYCPFCGASIDAEERS